MRGPIIKEYLTNATVAGGGATQTFRLKHDGRYARIFVKGTVDAGYASGALSVQLKPVAHFSDASSAVNWPLNTAGTSDYLVFPPNGLVSVTAGGAFSACIATAEDGDFGEYEITIRNTTENAAADPLDVTGVYLVSELT